jgi:hypothetical protein
MGTHDQHEHQHAHGLEHDHPHGHEHHERYADRAHPEFVVLEIGGDLGALIVYTDPGLQGREIEISPTGDDARRQHKDVLERSLGGRPSFTAVFDQIPGGGYTLWVDDQARAREVVVRGGEVAELDWRSDPVASPEDCERVAPVSA